MKVSVWDTYVKKDDGSVIHFDILVPEEVNDDKKICDYGRMHLQSRNISNFTLDSEECQKCHIEVASEQVVDSISDKGYFIIEMDDIPAELPENPSRSQMILYLRANFPKYRFAEFKGLSDEEILKFIQS
jgi:hypothetical protein